MASTLARGDFFSLHHAKCHVALERAATWRGDGYLATASAAGHFGHDLGAGQNFELRRSAIKADGSRPRQTVSQDRHPLSHHAGCRICFYERAQPHRQAEDRAIVVAPLVGRGLEVAVGPLHRRVERLKAVKVVEGEKGGQHARRSDLKDRVAPLGGAVEIPIRPLYQSAVWAGTPNETVQGSQFSPGDILKTVPSLNVPPKFVVP
jgi:hypothetical protein